MAAVTGDLDHLRVMTKVARLYHVHGMRQTEIAKALGVSQARVSRLLSAAEAAGIVRTVVVVPDGLNADLEEQLERTYGLLEAHVVEAAAADESRLTDDLGHAVASIVEVLPLDDSVIGFTSWSRSLRAMAAELRPGPRSAATSVVEMLGGVGPPALQQEATVATQRLARVAGAEPRFLRVPGVVSSPEVRDAILAGDSNARAALAELDEMDIALVGIGHCGIVPPLEAGDNFFSEEQFARALELGAVGQVNLRFIDAEGRPVPSELDELVIGVTLEQLQRAPRRIGVAGGPSKYEAIRAALAGGWVNVLVTDTATAEYLLAPHGASSAT
ncbi:sugar-binding transcriptional regulator [Agromyces sp. C10]|uniref:sugar-binding transcriptional regulator n=1 Tax=Agromyces sp. C10 TaxID=2935077 RepID=UPI00200B4223|nr:sugar-binding domain-containing protein [Agromyces sp. C10]MCK8610121.1 MarR family transcriptional regulator [Agromyces sp. C10]